MDCDRIARWYRWLEYGAFGSLLQKCRFEFLPVFASARNVLMLGEGDGRFLAAYLKRYPDAHIDYVDASLRMTQLARRRIALPAAGGLCGRVRFLYCDARSLDDGGPYDLIVTHFFLDCLHQEQVAELVCALLPRANSDACWVVSDFRIPPRGLLHWAGSLLVRILYEFFARLSGLQVKRLPDHRSVFFANGLRLRRERFRLGGILVSELWILGGLDAAHGKGLNLRVPAGWQPRLPADASQGPSIRPHGGVS